MPQMAYADGILTEDERNELSALAEFCKFLNAVHCGPRAIESIGGQSRL